MKECKRKRRACKCHGGGGKKWSAIAQLFTTHSNTWRERRRVWEGDQAGGAGGREVMRDAKKPADQTT
jgi:hypothetical protein